MLKAHNNKLNVQGFEDAHVLDDNKWNGSFHFIQAADTQYGLISHFKTGIPEEEITWSEEIRLTRLMVEAINKMDPKPKFAIICGDLIDAFPGRMWQAEQLRDFCREFENIQVPLLCVCGNHDLGDTPTKSSVQDFVHRFGDDYFCFWIGGVYCIVLNSQFFQDDSLVKDLSGNQEAWLEEQLRFCKQTRPKHVLIFQHIPWFLSRPDEQQEYFNLPCALREKWLKKFADCGVNAVFCGHFHRNAGGFYGNMEVVTTSAVGKQIGDDLSGLRIVKVFENKITHTYHDMDNIPFSVSL